MQTGFADAGARPMTFGRRSNTAFHAPQPAARPEPVAASVVESIVAPSRRPPAAAAYDPERRAAWFTFTARLVLGVAAACLFLWRLQSMLTPAILGILISHGGLKTLWLPAAAYTLGVVEYATRPLRKLKPRFRSDLVDEVCEQRNVRYVPFGFDPPALEVFSRLHLLPRFDALNCRDLILGDRGSAEFWLYQTCLTTQTRRRETVVFAGQLMQVRMPTPAPGLTVVRHRRGLIDDTRTPAGLRPISLGVTAFDRVFQAFGTDQVDARTVLHPGLIEKLVEMDAIYAGLNLGCAFSGSELLVSIEGARLFDAGDLSLSAVTSKDVAAAIGQDLDYVFGLMDRFLARPKLAYA